MSRVDSMFTPTERFTGGVPTITTDHEYIHDKKAFRLLVKTPSISAGESYDVAIRTPNAASGKYIHMRPVRFASSANLLEITATEGETVTGGTPATPVNQNRVGTPPASSVTAAVGVTVTPAGTVVDQAIVGSGGNATTRGGGSGGESDELLLKQDTSYNFRLANVGSTTATVGYLMLFWYEEDNG